MVPGESLLPDLKTVFLLNLHIVEREERESSWVFFFLIKTPVPSWELHPQYVI